MCNNNGGAVGLLNYSDVRIMNIHFKNRAYISMINDGKILITDVN